MRVFREEVFGPVLSVIRWSDEAQMWRDVNSLEVRQRLSLAIAGDAVRRSAL